MLRLAGEMAGPIGLKFLLDTHGWPGVLQAKKIFHGQHRALSASSI